jgi:predicted transcriptional regulator
MYRKKGFGETLETLSQFKKKEIQQNLFFKSLKANESYLNSFFRVKEDLIKIKIIGYKLDENNEKVIFLTEKGKELFKYINEIETILLNKDFNNPIVKKEEKPNESK